MACPNNSSKKKWFMKEQEEFLTERDYATLRGMGFPLASNHELDHPPTPHEALQSSLRVFSSPNARLVEAAAFALAKLAGTMEYGSFVPPKEEKALRRLGFVLECLAQHYANSAEKVRQLQEWIDAVKKNLPPLGFLEPLALTNITTQSRLRRLQENASVENENWRVYGQLEFRV
jgi:hypothetical protein